MLAEGHSAERRPPPSAGIGRRGLGLRADERGDGQAALDLGDVDAKLALLPRELLLELGELALPAVELVLPHLQVDVDGTSRPSSSFSRRATSSRRSWMSVSLSLTRFSRCSIHRVAWVAVSALRRSPSASTISRSRSARSSARSGAGRGDRRRAVHAR